MTFTATVIRRTAAAVTAALIATVSVANTTPADAAIRKHHCSWIVHHLVCHPPKSRPIVGTATPRAVVRLPVIPPRPIE